MSDRRFVDVDGLRTRVFVQNGRGSEGRNEDGPTLVFLHGMGGNYLIWPPQLRRMDGALVIAPDLPGHGESEGEGYADVAGYATFGTRLLHALRAEGLHVERPIVVGHSLGAAIALTMAQRKWSEVAGVGVLAGGERLPISDELFDGVSKDYGDAFHSIADASLDSDVRERRRALYLKRLRQLDAGVLQRDLQASRAFDARSWAHEVDAPALLIHGGEDRMVPASCSRSLHGRMPHSELHILEGAGHMFLWSRADEVRRLLRRFMERTENVHKPTSGLYGE